MSRPRQYTTPAERQAANRRRRDDERAELHDALYRLENAVWEASYRGDPLALVCRASSNITLLTRLVAAFERRPAPDAPG
jgi:hypothetical protein